MVPFVCAFTALASDQRVVIGSGKPMKATEAAAAAAPLCGLVVVDAGAGFCHGLRGALVIALVVVVAVLVEGVRARAEVLIGCVSPKMSLTCRSKPSRSCSWMDIDSEALPLVLFAAAIAADDDEGAFVLLLVPVIVGIVPGCVMARVLLAVTRWTNDHWS